MSEICIPVPDLVCGEQAEILVQSDNGHDPVRYRVEIFPLGGNGSVVSLSDDTAFISFKQFVDNYDKSWELIQVIASQDENKNIRVLYRKR
jgi:hypothetical protein